MIEVLSGGALTTVQDLGRFGNMSLGIGQTGVMDSLSAGLANLLVGNDVSQALIEITLVGPKLKFHQACTIAITGATFDLSLNGKAAESNRALCVEQGDELFFGRRQAGARAYLAVAGGIDVAKVFGSCATHLNAGFGGYLGRKLERGDLLAFPIASRTIQGENQAVRALTLSGSYLLRVTDSVESQLFSKQQWQAFTSQKYQVAMESNRIGIRLTGEAIDVSNLPELLSGGVLPGSIQIPPSGLPIIVGNDGPTVGGYPRIANVIAADMPLVGQLVAGDTISFARVTTEHARKFYVQQQQLLAAKPVIYK